MYTNSDNSDERTKDGRKRTLLASLTEIGIGAVNEDQSRAHKRGDDEPDTFSNTEKRNGIKADDAQKESTRTVLDEDDAPASAELSRGDEKHGTFKRVMVAVGVALGSLILLVGIGYFWILGGRRDEMAYQVKNTQSPANTAANDPAQGITAEEIARELKKPAATDNLPNNSRAIAADAKPPLQSGSPVTDRLPNEGFSATVNPNSATAHQTSTATTSGTNQSAPAATSGTGKTEAATQATKDSRPNAEHSIRISALQAANNSVPSSASPQNHSLAGEKERANTFADQETNSDSSAMRNSAPSVVPLPPLGTMLPVRTLGTVFTLRSDAYVRMELTRDMAGRGWSLPRGTEFYGVIRGAELETGRAYVSLIGFIDAGTNRLVRLQGNLLGGDGADGVRGRKHKLNSGWSRALKTAGAGMVDALSTVAAGIGRRPIYIGDIYGTGAPRAISPLAQEISGVADGGGRRNGGFVEVPTNTTGYVLVMTSPREIQGVDADVSIQATELRRLSDASAPRTNAQLSEQEIAELMTNGSPDDIRRALPRMSPGMRRVAEAFLSQK